MNDQIEERKSNGSGGSGDFDLSLIADGLDSERRARAASRIASHFSELRGEVERLQERVARQTQVIQSLEERVKLIEAASKSQSDAARSDAPVEKKSANAQPTRRRPFFGR